MAKKATVKVADFSNVKDRGNFNPKLVADGDYAAVVTKVEDAEVKKGDNQGKFQYLFTIKLAKYSQYTYPYYCQLDANQLWKLRNLAIAAGINVPKKRTKFDPNKIVGKKIGVTMSEDEPYQGKTKSSIDAVFPLSELAGDDLPEDDSEAFDDESEPEIASDDVDDSADEAEAPKKSKKDKGKKKNKAKKSKGELEELNINDV